MKTILFSFLLALPMLLAAGALRPSPVAADSAAFVAPPAERAVVHPLARLAKRLFPARKAAEVNPEELRRQADSTLGLSLGALVTFLLMLCTPLFVSTWGPIAVLFGTGLAVLAAALGWVAFGQGNALIRLARSHQLEHLVSKKAIIAQAIGLVTGIAAIPFVLVGIFGSFLAILALLLP